MKESLFYSQYSHSTNCWKFIKGSTMGKMSKIELLDFWDQQHLFSQIFFDILNHEIKTVILIPKSPYFEVRKWHFMTVINVIKCHFLTLMTVIQCHKVWHYGYQNKGLDLKISDINLFFLKMNYVGLEKLKIIFFQNFSLLLPFINLKRFVLWLYWARNKNFSYKFLYL